MRVPVDLHGDDLTMRLQLIDQLREIREAEMSTAELDVGLGVAHGTSRALERRTSWEASTLLRYARAVGRRVVFDLHDVRIPDDGDLTAIVLAAGDTSTPEREDRVHWRRVCNQLRRARRANHTAVRFAARLGVTENAVHYWEAHPDGSSLIAAQRHARGLDGWLGYHLAVVPAYALARHEW